jgi:DNA-binding response OmpR family regulator/HPt (histidine-containing phosphotransfer) domain-containing protein
VDDEPLNVKLLTAKLTAVGYDVIEAYSGQEGLDKAAAEYPDLLLLDVMMPLMDGFEVTRSLKHDPHTYHIPIILVTALDARENKSIGLEAGADDFLNKPINNVELQSRVRSLLDLKRYRDQASGKKQATRPVVPIAHQQALYTEGQRIPTVLLVEDNETDAQMIQLYLKRESLQVQLYADGETALRRAREGNVDLILLDILLPDINGFEICRLLKEADETRDIQILMLTCLADLESKTKGIELGADDYLVKPIDEKELKARIKTLLEKKCYLDSLASSHGTDHICASQGELSGKENHGNTTTPMVMEAPQPVTDECNSVETCEIVGSRNEHDDMEAKPTSFSKVQSGPANVALDRNALEQIIELERRGSSKSLLETLVNTYLDTTPELLEQLHKGARQDNPKALRETAHRLQSSSANLGALTLANLCRKLEVKARTNSTRNAVEMVSHIEREYEKVRHGLTEVLKTRHVTE